jgi:hypothetical protein
MEGPELAANASDIVGTWHALSGRPGDPGLYHQFNEDGTCLVALILERLPAEPDVRCEFRFEDTQFVYTEIEAIGLPPCGGEPAFYEVQLLASGNLKFVRIEDACAPRAGATAVEHEPVQ